MEIKIDTSITGISSITYLEACSQAFLSRTIPDFPGNPFNQFGDIERALLREGSLYNVSIKSLEILVNSTILGLETRKGRRWAIY